MKKYKGMILSCALLAVLTLALPASAAERTAPVMMAPQDAGTHTQYMEGTGERFNPERPVTRAELAQMLVRVVADEPQSAPGFDDVPEGEWYAPAASKAVGLGLMDSRNGLFRPTDPATRAECASALAPLLPYDAQGYLDFPDVQPGYWAYGAIARTSGYGLFKGDTDGNFRPESSLKRCEVVAVFNRLMGREPDKQYIAALGQFKFFSDVSDRHWAYWDIAEAAISHDCASDTSGAERWIAADVALPDGPQRVGGWLCWVENGTPIRNQSVGDLWFDENGHYTTGNEDLDTRLNAIVEQQTNSSMTRDQKLRALFDYVVNNYRYLARPMVAKGSTGWEPEYALYFLQNGKGNCFSFAAAYCLLCRELGLPAKTWVGASRNANSPHSWVEIPLDGATYMFDPELQWYYNNRTSMRVDLFKMLPSTIPAGVYRYIW